MTDAARDIWWKLLDYPKAVSYLGNKFYISNFPFLAVIPKCNNPGSIDYRVQLSDWILNNTKLIFSPISWNMFLFSNEDDATLFKLTWC